MTRRNRPATRKSTAGRAASSGTRVPVQGSPRTVTGKQPAGAMSEVSRRILCPTCVHEEYCSLYSDRSRAAWYCEEFEAASAPGQRSTASSSSREASAHTEARRMGLCFDCEHRDTCTFPRPEGGVWRCDEYE